MDVLGEPPANFPTICTISLTSYIVLFRESIFPQNPSRFYVVLRRCLTVLVIVHTLYTLRLLLSPPIDLFSLLDLPLTAPVQAIRVALLKYQRNRFPVGFQNVLLPHVETLLTRLASFEARVTYVKYGPYALAKCEPCVYASDFVTYTVAPTVLPYLRTLILVSLITSAPTFRTAWRTPSLFVLAATFFTEIWWTIDNKAQFHNNKVTGWTFVHTYLARYAILLLLPFIIHLLPAHSSPSPLPPFITVTPARPTLPHQSSDFNLNDNARPSTPRRSHSSPSVLATSATTPDVHAQQPMPATPFSALNGAISSLSTTLGALHVLEFARLAGLRRRELREQITDYFATADSNSLYARSDPEVLQEAEKIGMGYSIRTKEGICMSKEQNEKGSQEAELSSKTPSSQTNREYRSPSVDEGDSSEEEDVTQSPLRSKARMKAQEIAKAYLQTLPRGSRPGGVL